MQSCIFLLHNIITTVIWAARARTHGPEISIIPPASIFVNRQLTQTFVLYFPKTAQQQPAQKTHKNLGLHSLAGYVIIYMSGGADNPKKKNQKNLQKTLDSLAPQML